MRAYFLSALVKVLVEKGSSITNILVLKLAYDMAFIILLSLYNMTYFKQHFKQTVVCCNIQIGWIKHYIISNSVHF